MGPIPSMVGSLFLEENHFNDPTPDFLPPTFLKKFSHIPISIASPFHLRVPSVPSPGQLSQVSEAPVMHGFDTDDSCRQGCLNWF